MKSVESQLNEALELVKEKDDLIRTLKRVIHQKQLTIATIQRDWQLKEGGLSPEAIKRLHQAFTASTDNAGLKQAINVERKKHGSPN